MGRQSRQGVSRRHQRYDEISSTDSDETSFVTEGESAITEECTEYSVSDYSYETQDDSSKIKSNNWCGRYRNSRNRTKRTDRRRIRSNQSGSTFVSKTSTYHSENIDESDSNSDDTSDDESDSNSDDTSDDETSQTSSELRENMVGKKVAINDADESFVSTMVDSALTSWRQDSKSYADTSTIETSAIVKKLLDSQNHTKSKTSVQMKRRKPRCASRNAFEGTEKSTTGIDTIFIDNRFTFETDHPSNPLPRTPVHVIRAFNLKAKRNEKNRRRNEKIRRKKMSYHEDDLTHHAKSIISKKKNLFLNSTEREKTKTRKLMLGPRVKSLNQTSKTVAEPSAASISPVELDYDVKPTELFWSVETKQWDRVIKKCKENPTEAKIWVYRKVELDHQKQWKRLPIHAALLLNSPVSVVEALMEAYPESGEQRDDLGRLPMDLALINEVNNRDLVSLSSKVCKLSEDSSTNLEKPSDPIDNHRDNNSLSSLKENLSEGDKKLDGKNEAVNEQSPESTEKPRNEERTLFDGNDSKESVKSTSMAREKWNFSQVATRFYSRQHDENTDGNAALNVKTAVKDDADSKECIEVQHINGRDVLDAVTWEEISISEKTTNLKPGSMSNSITIKKEQNCLEIIAQCSSCPQDNATQDKIALVDKHKGYHVLGNAISDELIIASKAGAAIKSPNREHSQSILNRKIRVMRLFRQKLKPFQPQSSMMTGKEGATNTSITKDQKCDIVGKTDEISVGTLEKSRSASTTAYNETDMIRSEKSKKNDEFEGDGFTFSSNPIGKKQRGIKRKSRFKILVSLFNRLARGPLLLHSEVQNMSASTMLYQVIEAKNWDRAIKVCEKEPKQAQIWVQGRDENSGWNRLPIHAAVILKCPLTVIKVLLQSFPDSVMAHDNNGCLPIDLAKFNGAGDEIILLLAAYPNDTSIIDERSRDFKGNDDTMVEPNRKKMSDVNTIDLALAYILGAAECRCADDEGAHVRSNTRMTLKQSELSSTKYANTSNERTNNGIELNGKNQNAKVKWSTKYANSREATPNGFDWMDDETECSEQYFNKIRSNNIDLSTTEINSKSLSSKNDNGIIQCNTDFETEKERMSTRAGEGRFKITADREVVHNGKVYVKKKKTKKKFKKKQRV